MIEKQIKAEYKLGTRRGITELDDCFYMPVRITGTGKNLRQNDEGEPIVCDRSTSNFLTPAFIEHAATLPIVVEHPKEKMLSSANLKDNPIVGNCIDAWIENSEVWGLARVFDKGLLEKFGKEINSTSPAVYIDYVAAAENGVQKEEPILLNHLAFVDRGHWDSEQSAGYDDSKIEKIEMQKSEECSMVVRNDIIPEKEDSMTEEIKKVSDSAEEIKKVSDSAEEQKAADTEEQKAADTEEQKAADTEEQKAADTEEQKAADTEEIVEVDESEVEEIGDDEVKHVIVEDDGVESLEPLEDDDTEVIDSEDEVAEDKARDEAVDAMRAACDSAHASLNVKMPHLTGRQTLRSVVNKFVQRNRGFLPQKYSNLAVDSYTPELAKEVLAATIDSIKVAGAKFGEKKEGFVDTGKGYSILQGFGWKSRVG